MTHAIRRRRHCTSGAGFTLIHMLGLMALLGVFMLLAGHLFRHAAMIMRDGDRHEADVVHLDALLRHMRTDVWQAGTIEVSDAQHLMLALGDDDRITWRITRDGDPHEQVTRIIRQATARTGVDTTKQFVIRAPATIEAGEASVRLHVGEQSVTLVSQHRLLEIQP